MHNIRAKLKINDFELFKLCNQNYTAHYVVKKFPQTKSKA